MVSPLLKVRAQRPRPGNGESILKAMVTHCFRDARGRIASINHPAVGWSARARRRGLDGRMVPIGALQAIPGAAAGRFWAPLEQKFESLAFALRGKRQLQLSPQLSHKNN